MILNCNGRLIFSNHFQIWQGHSLPYDLGRVRLRRFCRIRYTQNCPRNEPVDYGIPWFIFKIKVIKFVKNVVLSMLLKIRSWFHHNRKTFGDFFHVSECRALKVTVSTLTSVIFIGSFSNMAQLFIGPSPWIFDYEETVSLNMYIMNHLMSWSCLVKLWKFGGSVKLVTGSSFPVRHSNFE